MELCSEGDVREMLETEGGPFTERECLSMGAQLIQGLEALHVRNVVHGDLKPENVFASKVSDSTGVGAHYSYKIGDLGLAQHQDRIKFVEVGTPGFIAPEIRTGFYEYDIKADIWSLGMVPHTSLSPTFDTNSGPNQNSKTQTRLYWNVLWG